MTGPEHYAEAADPAAVTGDPDVRRTRGQGRDRPPGRRGGAREAVRSRVETTRRVGRGQC
jgi:hypothetical protein